MIRKAINSIFASARVKTFAIRQDVPKALTYIDTRMPSGVLRRHQLDITVSKFLQPSEGLQQVVIWKALQAFVKQNASLGELAYVCYNGTVFSVDI